MPKQFSGHHAAFFVPCSSFSASFLLSRALNPSLFPLVFYSSPSLPSAPQSPFFDLPRSRYDLSTSGNKRRIVAWLFFVEAAVARLATFVKTVFFSSSTFCYSPPPLLIFNRRHSSFAGDSLSRSRSLLETGLQRRFFRSSVLQRDFRDRWNR